MFEMWNTLDHEICSTYMPQPLKVLCIRVKDYILPGAKHGASCKQAAFLLGETDNLKGLLCQKHSQLHHQPFPSTSAHWRPLISRSGRGS
uniref:Alternative protein FAM198B n=1 Tax=Homo sapiens TaxID=9606 RepID=L8E9X9_HUMAN|nr:alternative protein FAM198B [Homo sapiens]